MSSYYACYNRTSDDTKIIKIFETLKGAENYLENKFTTVMFHFTTVMFNHNGKTVFDLATQPQNIPEKKLLAVANRMVAKGKKYDEFEDSIYLVPDNGYFSYATKLETESKYLGEYGVIELLDKLFDEIDDVDSKNNIKIYDSCCGEILCTQGYQYHFGTMVCPIDLNIARDKYLEAVSKNCDTALWNLAILYGYEFGNYIQG